MAVLAMNTEYLYSLVLVSDPFFDILLVSERVEDLPEKVFEQNTICLDFKPRLNKIMVRIESVPAVRTFNNSWVISLKLILAYLYT